MQNAFRRTRFISLATLLLQGPIHGAAATEPIAYSYDARGRLVQVTRSVPATPSAVISYSYDAAGNRMSHSVTGATIKAVVVPLNGFKIIPIG